MSDYRKNKYILEKSFNYNQSMEHDACGVGLIASTNGKKSRKIVEYGIEALKAIWHRGAVDADGKSGDGAGIQIEIAPDFFKEKILSTGHTLDENKRKSFDKEGLTVFTKGETVKCIVDYDLFDYNINVF